MKQFVFCITLSVVANALHQQELVAANPIRKVVNMLQMMQKKVAAEGEKEKALYQKFQCYCRTNGGNLQQSIAAANTKMPQVASDIKEAESQKVQLSADIKQAQADRTAAKAAMADATALREKEAATFAAFKAESDANIGALGKAIAALDKGMTGSFLQTSEASALRKLILASQDMVDADRQEILAFLSNSDNSEYAPQSGEIVGILKELKETMEKGLAEETASEHGSIKSFEELMAAKQKEIYALSAAIETKTVRMGDLGVQIVQMQDDLSDTEAALMEDTKFLADLETNCGSKKEEWDMIQKTRAEEQVALAETIKILNDDDALELFKKTLPGASSSFMQLRVASDIREHALGVLRTRRSVNLDLITLALQGKKIGFEKVIKMIDDMVALLKKEQIDDDDKKEYCGTQFDSLDDKRKGLERSVSDIETAITDAEGRLAQLTADLKALSAGIKALDKAVAEATEQRREENTDFKDLMASDAAAKQLLNLAKNHLNKFYNPKLYKPPPKRELSEEERITVNMGGSLAPTNPPGGIAGTGVTVLADVNAHVAPPPPPETFDGYSKKSEESTGVIAMIDLLIADLDKEMTEAQTTEKNSQKQYEQMMMDSSSKRRADSKSLQEKGAAKADTEVKLESAKESKTGTVSELMATMKVIQNLHTECDWLIQYFDVRKEARAGEIDSLVKAKAILSGADFAFLQTNLRR